MDETIENEFCMAASILQEINTGKCLEHNTVCGLNENLMFQFLCLFFFKKLYGPFLWMGFNCLKARATSRRQLTFYH